MRILEEYFLNWYFRLAYFGNAIYSCFLLVWAIGIIYELSRTLKKIKRLQKLDTNDYNSWKKHHNDNIFKLTLMLAIILLEGVQVVLSQMDALYTPTHFALYGNKTNSVNSSSEYADTLYCLSTNKFVGAGLGIFSARITVFLYIIWTYSLCLNFCSMAYVNNKEWGKLCRHTVMWIVLSSLVPLLMISKYTVPTGVLSYFLLIVIAAIHLVLSQKQLLRALQTKRFDLNQESSKRQVRRIDKELRCVKKIGGLVIIIGLVKIFFDFICGSIDNTIIPVARNPCWIPYFNSHHGLHTQVESITITIAQAVFTIEKLANISYVLMVLGLNVLFGCLYFYIRKIQLDRIVRKKYTNYGKPLTRSLLRETP